jgi:phage-related protein
MDSVTLSIIIAAQDKASAIFSALTGKMKEMGVMGDESARSLDKIGTSAEGSAAKLKTVGLIASGVVVAGVVAIGAHAVKVAGDFQQMTSTLVTTAGESEKNIGLVRSGILKLSTETGTGAEQMSKAMYTIESAGFHASNGLTVLKAAAQGAKAENADLEKVADAVTSTLIDYHLPASSAADITSKLVAAVGAGKSTFEGFTGALHSVLPVASAAHVNINDVLGSLASMTVHGMSADQAAQNLAHSILKMQSPTQSMTSELAQLGIKSSDLVNVLADPKKGISGALGDISNAIINKMGPSGKVMIDAFNGNKLMAEDAMKMFAAMPPSLQSVATAYSNGSMSVKDYRTTLKGLPTDQANLLGQFVGLTNRAKGFSDIMKTGKNPLQSYAQAMQAATGDATTMNVALMTTGENGKYTEGAVRAVGKAHAEAGNNVAGWAFIQKNFNQQLSQAKEGFHNMTIAIGSGLLPIATQLMGVIVKIVTPIAEWVEKHQKLAAIILGSIGAIAALTGTILAISAAFHAVSSAISIVGGAIRAVTAILAANPIILIVMAIALAAYLIITHWKQVSNFFKKLWDDVKEIFDVVWAWIKQHMVLLLAIILGPIGLLLGEVIKHWTAIKNETIRVFNEVLDFFKRIGHDVAAFFSRMAHDVEVIWLDIWHVIETILKAIWKVIETILLIILGLYIIAFKAIYRAVHDPIMDVWNFIVKIWNDVYNFIASILSTIWNVIVTVHQAIHDFIWKIIHAIADFLIERWNNIYANVSAILSAIWNVISSVWNTIWNFIMTVVHAIVNFLIERWNNMYANISAILSAIWNVITSIWNSIYSTISSILSSIWNTIVDIWNRCFNAVHDTLSRIWDTIKDIVGKIKNFFADAGGWLLDAGKNMVMGFVNGIKHAAGAAVDAAKGVAKDAIGAAKSFLGIKSPSTVFQEIGDNVGKGLQVGIQGTSRLVSDSTKGLAASAVSGAVSGISSGSSQLHTAINNNSNSSNVNNGKVEIHIHAGALMGNKAEAEQFATQIYQQLQRIARRHGNADTLPQIGILPQ